MNEKVCLITGAGRGIGRATAIELAHRGWALVLVSRTKAELDETAAQVPQALAVPADVTRSADIERAIAAGINRYGRIDAAVACAGAAPNVPIEQTTDEQYRLAIETNLTHTFYLTRAIWAHFKERKAGTIVNLSSFSSRDPFDGFGAYAAAKAGINLFSLVAAREGAPHGIRVHVVAPGTVETRMLRDNFPLDVVPTEAALKPEAVARVIAQIIDGDLACTSGEVIWVHR